MTTHYNQIKKELTANYSNYGFAICNNIVMDEWRNGYISKVERIALLDILDVMMDKYGIV